LKRGGTTAEHASTVRRRAEERYTAASPPLDGKQTDFTTFVFMNHCSINSTAIPDKIFNCSCFETGRPGRKVKVEKVEGKEGGIDLVE